jgi:hypothetical protein
MALEELLRLREQETDGARHMDESGAAVGKGSLIRKAAELAQSSAEEPGEEPDGIPETDVPMQYEDGYVRRSPVQPYYTAEDYEKKRIRKILTYAVVACIVVLLAVALMRSGMLRLR